MNGSYEAPYVNPKAPIHIVTGSAVSIPISGWSDVFEGL